jgi:hypothetical protein
MSISVLLSKPEFWSALFGALAAFLLGAAATWRSQASAKRTAGNLTLIALSQMYSLIENLRQQLLIEEPIRVLEATGGKDAFPFLFRAATGLPEQLPRIAIQDLGFLIDSHDPNVLNRLLTVERAFISMIDLVRRHEPLHARFQEALSAVDPTGRRQWKPEELSDCVGVRILIELDETIDQFGKGLPKTRDELLAVSRQLLDALRFQFPTRRFIRFIPASSDTSGPGKLPEPACWRKVARFVVEKIVIRPPKHGKPYHHPEAPAINRFVIRSWEGDKRQP